MDIVVINEDGLNFVEQWKLIIKSRAMEIMSYAVILAAIIIVGLLTNWISQTDKFGLVIQVTTLLGLSLVKLSQIKQEWKSVIPDYLTVEYIYKGQVQIKAELIPLVSLTGVREQVQAIAKALNNEKNVALYPVLHKIEHGKIIKIERKGFEHSGDAIELHKTTIELKNKLPELQNENLSTGEKTPAKLSEYGVDVDSGEYLYWSYPFKDTDIQINNSEHQCVRHVNKGEII